MTITYKFCIINVDVYMFIEYLMLNDIKSVILKDFFGSEKKWLFISIFSYEWNLNSSYWFINSDRDLDNLLDILLNSAKIDKNTWIVSIDVVTNVIESNKDDLLSTSPREYWILLSNKDFSAFGVILPDTEWVADSKVAIQSIIKKNNISWSIVGYKFTTKRYVIEIDN